MTKAETRQAAYLVERDYSIVKANEMIQKSKFNMTPVQQKIVLYLISKVKPDDEDFSFMEFDVADFCQVCGIDSKNYGNVKMVCDYIDTMDAVSWWMKTEDGMLTKMRWIEGAKIDESNGKLYIRLDNDLRPYLLQLQKNFTRYEFVFVLHFKSKYSIRLYEYIKSIHYNEGDSYIKNISLEALHDRLGADDYDQHGRVVKNKLNTWDNFKRRALEPAIKEINQYSDKTIEWYPIKKGHSVVGVSLKISTKSDIDRLKIRMKIDEELGIDRDQIVMDDW